MEKKNAQELFDSLSYKKKNVYESSATEEIKAIYDYAAGYMQYLDDSKTEREATNASIAMIEAKGYTEYKLGDELKPGDKKYFNNIGKSLIAFTIGEEDIEKNGIRIIASHIDSPRIDLKQVPLYEDSGMGFMKTHYYGGVKKYQWTAIPLALHGVMVKADGEIVEVKIGEDDTDPVFYINDLLPHLAQRQSQEPLGTAIAGETLNILVGGLPYDCDDVSDKIKLTVLSILHDKYGVTEEDFLSAELSLVPAFKARDIGFDRALIGAYGHDDRVCAYPALSAIFENTDSPHSLMCILADKEETGSDGNTGMQADIFTDLISDICASLGANQFKVRANSKCLSADVSAAYDPNFPEVFEELNCPLLSHGAILTKYTGARGKSSTNDASAEYIAWLRSVMDCDNVLWQTGELGKVDCGGGGTVAKYIAKHNIDTIDLGVPVISMHAPYEVVSKVDVYETYRAFCAFCKN